MDRTLRLGPKSAATFLYSEAVHSRRCTRNYLARTRLPANFSIYPSPRRLFVFHPPDLSASDLYLFVSRLLRPFSRRASGHCAYNKRASAFCRTDEDSTGSSSGTRRSRLRCNARNSWMPGLFFKIFHADELCAASTRSSRFFTCRCDENLK